MNSQTPPSQATMPRILLLAGALFATMVLLTACESIKRVTGGVFGIITESVPEEMRGRSLKDLVQDRRTASKVKAALVAAGPALFWSVDVHVYGGSVLLIGQVRNAERMALATELSKQVLSVNKVLNELQISPPRYSDRVHDNILVGKVKSALATRPDINVDRIKIVGTDRTIYLLGNLPSAKRQLVGQLATQVSGVRKVVNWITP